MQPVPPAQLAEVLDRLGSPRALVESTGAVAVASTVPAAEIAALALMGLAWFGLSLIPPILHALLLAMTLIMIGAWAGGAWLLYRSTAWLWQAKREVAIFYAAPTLALPLLPRLAVLLMEIGVFPRMGFAMTFYITLMFPLGVYLLVAAIVFLTKARQQSKANARLAHAA